MPELIQEMVMYAADDHGMEEDEVARLKLMLNTEFVTQRIAREKSKEAQGEKSVKRVDASQKTTADMCRPSRRCWLLASVVSALPQL